MRCALVSTAPIWGGVWRHVLDLAGGLQEFGEDVTIYGPEQIVPVLKKRCPQIRIETLNETILADIVHLHLADTYEKRHGQFIRNSVSRGSTVVVTEHLPRSLASDPRITLSGIKRKPGSSTWKRFSKRHSLSSASAVIAVSEETRDFLIQRYGFPPSKIVAVPLEIDVHTEPIDMPTSQRFVAAGSIITQKGFDVLVEASMYRNANWTVDVFGSGPHLARLQERAVELGGFVRFRGFSDDILNEMDNSRGVVIPSRWESCPYALLEAMSRGRPVVVSRVDAMPRIVTQAHCGFVFDSGDPKGLAVALDELLLSNDSDQLGRNGYANVSRMSTRSMAQRTIEVYRKAQAS